MKTTRITKTKFNLCSQLLIPKNKKYKNELIKKLKMLNIDFVIFDKFLNNEEIAHLRFACDIMIQLQPTDVLSGSMQEHMFAKNIVITGAWLPYGELIKKNLFSIKIQNVGDIGGKLIYNLNNYEKEKENCKKNTQIMDNYGSWETNIKSWIRLYQNLEKKYVILFKSQKPYYLRNLRVYNKLQMLFLFNILSKRNKLNS